MTIGNQIHSSRGHVVALALGGMFFLCGHARAALLLPGAPAETTPGAYTFAGLTTVADETSTVTAFDNSGTARYTAEVETKVLKEPTGTLDFAYQVTNETSTEPDSIEFVTLTSYRSFTTSADYVSGSGNVSYANIVRNAPVAGFTISMDFSPNANNIANGDSTDWIIIKTNAVVFDNGGTTNLEDGAVASVPSFEPIVPEPMSLSLLAAAGTALLGGRPGRRNRTLA